LEILTAVLGAANVSHVPLEFFSERFHLAPTLGKLANIVHEFGSQKRIDEGVLKAFVAGNRMFFDRKNRPAVQARPTARLAFSTNAVPIFHDRSEGVWRRMILLPMNVAIPVDRQDPRLVETLNQELPGIFNWSLEGCRRLKQRGRFTEPDVCRTAFEDHRRECDSSGTFLEDHVAASEGGVIPCADLYDRYRDWARGNGFESVNSSQLGKAMTKRFPRCRRHRQSTGDRLWVYEGVCWMNPDNHLQAVAV
jgi:putative DNA primase/helicase